MNFLGERIGRLLRLAGWFLLFGVPLLTLLWLFDRMATEEMGNRLRNVETATERDMDTLFYRTDPRRWFCRSFRKTAAFIEAHGGGAAVEVASLPRFFPEAFQTQLVVFSPSGSGRYPRWCRPMGAPVVKTFWADLAAGKGEMAIGATRMQRYRSLFGMGFMIDDLLAMENSPYPIGPGTTDGALVWKRLPGGGGLLAFSRDLPSPWAMARQFLRGNPRSGRWAAVEGLDGGIVTAGNWTPEWKTWFVEGIRQGGGTFVRSGALLRVTRHLEGFWLGRLQTFRSPWAGVLGPRIWILVSALLLVWIVGRVGLQNDPFADWRIGQRLAAFFVLGSVLPVVLLISSGIRAYFQGAILRETSVHEANLARTRAMDVAYKQELDRLRVFFRTLREHPVVRGSDQKAFASLTSALEKRRLIFGAHTRDAYARPVLVSESEKQALDDAVVVPLQRLIRPFLHLPEIPPSNDTEKLLLQIFSSSGFGLGPAFSRTNQLQPYAMGLREFIRYYDLIVPSPGQPAAFFHVKQFLDWNIDRFFRRCLPPEFLVFQDKYLTWYPREPSLAALERLPAQVVQGRKPVYTLVGQGDDTQLVSACPSTELAGVCYLVVTPFGEHRRAVAGQRRQLIGGALLVFFLGFLCSRLLSGALLGPIGIITAGIQALEERRWRHRLADLGEDEFGDIGRAMNRLSAEMLEIDRATEVQKKMLPKVLPTLADYEVAVHFQPTSDLGGDYVDIMDRPDGEVGFVVGDVTGHGIGSALLTASAKVLFYQACREGRSPVAFLDALNQYIQQTLKRKKHMTVVTALLDPRTHLFRWWTGGHPYLLLHQPGSEAAYVGKPGVQAGIRAKTIWPSFERTLQPGETVLFYSDGIPEALDQAQNAFGYPRLQDVLTKGRGRNAEEILQEILGTLETFAAGVPLGDDLTLLVLRRRPGKA